MSEQELRERLECKTCLKKRAIREFKLDVKYFQEQIIKAEEDLKVLEKAQQNLTPAE